jgi:RNA polymerase sigma-70 factor (ECF subfamily)
MNPGDERFEDLYKRFVGRIYIFLVRFGFSRDRAEDLAQEAFLRVYRNMGRYRGDAQWNYLEAVAKSVALNAVRATRAQKRKGEEVAIDEQHNIVDSAQSIEERLDQQARIVRLREAIEELPPPLRICLKLRLDDLTLVEVAKILNITVDAVKSRLRHARSELRERLGAEVEDLENDDDQQS